MANFRGKNGQGVRNLFGERVNYMVNAFPMGANNLPLPPIKDFSFAENRFYGRIDRNHDVIALNSSRLAAIPSGAGTLRAVNFVVDAFEAMVQDFQKAAFGKRISNTDPYLATLEATKAFVDPNSEYAIYVGTLVKYCVGHYLTRERRQLITSFDSFVPVFIDFIKDTSLIQPITKPAFIASAYCDSSVSGLTIQLAALNAGDDTIKGEFIASPNFSFFKSVALKHGFSIDKNVPWRLTADISSPPMLNYAVRYGARNEAEVLSNFYGRVYGGDIINLKKLAIECYNSFVALYPKNLDKGGACLKPITLKEFVTSYPSTFWVDKYLDVRYNEQKKPISGPARKVLNKKVRDAQVIGGIPAALQVINEVLRGFANFEGSFSKQYLKQQNQKTGQNLKPTY